MSGYNKDRVWSDRFIPEICRIVGPLLLVPSSLEVDCHEAADLVVLRGRDMTLACRVRRPGFLRYKGEFTIRAKRDSGAKTELEKITEGWGDWMFYAHASEEGVSFTCWHLLDLAAWRAHLIRDRRDREKIKWGLTDNGDGTHFAWFRIVSFVGDPPLVIAQSEETNDPF